MKFLSIIFLIFCGVQFISTKSVEPKDNDVTLVNASVIDEISQLIQAAVENLTTQAEQFIQNLQDSLQNLIQTTDESLNNYANATARQVEDLIGDSVSFQTI